MQTRSVKRRAISTVRSALSLSTTMISSAHRSDSSAAAILSSSLKVMTIALIFIIEKRGLYLSLHQSLFQALENLQPFFCGQAFGIQISHFVQNRVICDLEQRSLRRSFSRREMAREFRSAHNVQFI